MNKALRMTKHRFVVLVSTLLDIKKEVKNKSYLFFNGGSKQTKLELFYLNLSMMKIRFYELCKLHKIFEKQISNFSFNKKGL